jgi:hypothetical protein
MLDPISALASLAQIIDVSTKVVGGLRRARDRYKGASLNVDLLIGQICTLQAALDQIVEWISTPWIDFSTQNQLLKDFNISLESCYSLMLLLQRQIGDKLNPDTNELSLSGKLKLVLDENTIRERSEQLRNQVVTLQFLLIAFQW